MNSSHKASIDWIRSNNKKVRKLSSSVSKSNKYDGKIRQLHGEVFEDLDCLECANCCRTTGPLLTNKDISRIAKHLKLSESSFVQSYLRIDEEGDFVFKSMPCPFLGDDNYCSIYEVRPRACKAFPHTDAPGQASIFHLTRKNARICPGVAQILKRLIESET